MNKNIIFAKLPGDTDDACPHLENQISLGLEKSQNPEELCLLT